MFLKTKQSGDASPGQTIDHTNPITEGRIGTEMLRFFFPILLGSLFQQIYNTADAMIVGRVLGKVALSAVGASGGMIVMLIVSFFVGLSSGATVLTAQHVGAGDEEQVKNTVHTAMAFSVLCGAFITVIGILMTPTFLRWMKTPEDTMEMSVIYLRVYFTGMIGNLLYNVGAGILRAAGDSRRPFIFLVISCFLNILLDLLFVITFRWGIFGAALATILSQAVSACLIIIIMLNSRESYRLIPAEIRIDQSVLARITQIGFPAGMQSIMYGLSNIIIQVAVNGLGTDYVAAWATYFKIDGVFWMTLTAFSITGATFVGQNYGAGLTERVRSSVRINLFQAFVASIGISIVVYLIAPWLFPLFVEDAAVIEIGIAMMRYLVRFYILYVSIEILSGVLRGIGDTFIPMVICGIGVCLLRSIWIIVMMPIHNDMYTMMNSYPLSWSISTIAFFIYTLKFSKLKI